MIGDRIWTRQPPPGTPAAGNSKFTALFSPGLGRQSANKYPVILSAPPTSIAYLSGGIAGVYTGTTDASATVPMFAVYPCVMAWSGRFLSGANNWVGIQVPGSGGAGGDLQQLRLGTGTQVEYVLRNSFGTSLSLMLSAPGGTSIGVDLVVIVQSFSATDHRIYCNGVMASSTTNVGAMSASKTVVWTGSGTAGLSNTQTYWAAVGNIGMSDEEALSITRGTAQWRLFAPLRRTLSVFAPTSATPPKFRSRTIFGSRAGSRRVA